MSKIDEITKIVGQKFRSFGGRQTGFNNPIAAAIKDGPLQFAAGVDIKSVVEVVLNEADLKQQPPAGEFTKNWRNKAQNLLVISHLAEEGKTDVSKDTGKSWTLLAKGLLEACDRLDSAEASKADLLAALEQIRDLETECCSRCEGNGRLYADGKAHLLSENADTVFCGNCGGSGRILPENAQDIAEAAIAKVKPEEKKHGGCWPEGDKENE